MAAPQADPFGRRTKALLSETKKLRGWVASSPDKIPAFVDALNELTAQRLVTHAFEDAAPEAQEALKEAHKLVMSHGALGPYTPPVDAGRFLTALAHLAADQAGLGQPAEAGAAASTAWPWMQQLPLLDLPPELKPATAVWLLSVVAGAALAEGDLARANRYADAARLRCDEGALADDAMTLPLAADTHALVASTRWAAGLVEDALGASERAAELWLAVAEEVGLLAGRASESAVAWVAPALVDALRVHADRLWVAARGEEAVDRRRAMVALLEDQTGRRWREPLRQAWAELARDLAALGRVDEAAEAKAAAQGAEPRAMEPLGQAGWVAWEPLGEFEGLAGSTKAKPVVEEPPVERMEPVVERRAEPAVETTPPVEPVEEPLVERRTEPAVETTPPVEPVEEPLVERRTEPAVETPAPAWEPEPPVEPEPVAAPEPAHEPPVERRTEPEVETPAPAWEPEPPVEPEPVAAPEPAYEPEPAYAPAPEPAPAASEPIAPTPAPEPELTPEQRLRAESERTLHAWRTAKASGDKYATRTTIEAAVAALRPLVELNEQLYGPTMVDALQELSEAMRKTGDWWSSRGPAKEAKQLAKRLR